MGGEDVRNEDNVAGDLRPQAVVGATGSIEELNDGRGRRLLETEPELVDLIRAFLECDLPELRFLYESLPRWYAVELRRLLGPSENAPAARAELIAVDAPYGLTPKELDVLTLVAGGLSNPEIAGHLRSSPRTIGTHVERILRKLDQTSRAGAAGLAVSEGLLRLPVPGGGRSISGLPVGHVDQRLRGWEVMENRRQIPSHVGTRRRERPFLIGSAFPLDGPAATDGVELQRGSALAIADVNVRGGIAGRPVEQLVVNADIFSPEGLHSAFQRLIDMEVDAITTGYAFAENPGCYEQPARYGCPLLNVMTSENQASWVRSAPDEFGNLFQVGPTEIHYGTGFVWFLDELIASKQWRPPNRKLVFVETPVPGGHISDQTTADRAERSGWTIDSVLHVNTREANWESTLRAIRSASPAAILIAHFLPTELIEFQRSFLENPTDSVLYGIYAPSSRGYVEEAGDVSEGLVWATATGLYSDAMGRGFSTRYAQDFGSPPGHCLAGVGYDQVNLLIQAWAQVGNPRAFRAVSSELRRNIHRGVNGAYSLANASQTGLAFPEDTPDPSMGQAHLVFQIQEQQHRILGPAPFAESRFVLPPWIGRC